MRAVWHVLVLYIAICPTLSKVDIRELARNFNFHPYDGAYNIPRNVTERLLKRNAVEEVRRQPQLPREMPFPCPPLSRSKATSVHALRPSDIDVVAAMGDSLVAGNGAMEDYALGTFIESRGVSWCVGGDGSWREFLTLPNIIKEYNPNVRGYSFGKAEFLSPTTAMNVAFPVSADEDALKQAKQLIYKMKQDPNINFKKDWKLVTMFFGANDLCSGTCYNKKMFSPTAHAFKLQKALDYLQDNLPRALVNLIPVIDVSVSVRLKRSFMCRMLHRLFCTCFHRGNNVMDTMTGLARRYQVEEQALISSGRYNKKNDFTVVIQPFMTMFNAPVERSLRYSEVIDISYITHDCFHFSQKGHALAANLLWNNMLEPVGRKSRKRIPYLMEKFYCPTEESPYFFTYNNSIALFTSGHFH